MKRIFVMSLALSVAFQSQAKKVNVGEAIATGTRTGDQLSSQISGDGQKGQETAVTANETLQQSAVDTTKNSQKGQTTALLIGAGLGAAAQHYYGVCASSGGTFGYAACITGGILVAMALQSKKSADSYKPVIDNASKNSCIYSTLGCAGTPPNPYTAGTGNPNINTGQLTAIAETLNKGGYEVDVNSGKIKSPKGTGNLNDPASMENLLGKEGFDKLMGEVRKAEADAKAKIDQVKGGAVTAALGFDGGGGGNSGAVTEAGYGDGTETGGSVASRIARLRNPSQAKGLTKNFNGDPIGVASDSIFEMMSRRYNLKNTQKTFYGPEAELKN